MWTSNSIPRSSSVRSMSGRFDSRQGSIHSIASPRAVSRSSASSVTGYESDHSSDTAAEDFAVQSTRAPGLMWAKQSMAPTASIADKFGSVEHIKEIKIVPLGPLRDIDDDGASETTLEGEEEFEVPEKTPTPWNIKRAPSPLRPKEFDEIKEIKIVPVPKTMPFMEDSTHAQEAGIKDVKIVPVPKRVMPFPENENPQPQRPVSQAAKPKATPAPAPVVSQKPTIKTIKTIPVPKHMPILDGEASTNELTWAEEQALKPSSNPGPLEQQLSLLMSKVIAIERAQPTISITPSELATMQSRLAALEAEKKTWTTRHETLYALRDEDLANLIHVRGLLASERRAHDALKKLRDDDLANLVTIRGKLADATRKLDSRSSTINSSPSKSIPDRSGAVTPPNTRPKSTTLERRSPVTLFEVAKTAALEQKVLELERANGALSSQLASVKELETKLRKKEDELSQLRESAHNWATAAHEHEHEHRYGHAHGHHDAAHVHTPHHAPVVERGVEWSRYEAMQDENLEYRERMGRVVAGLRCQKEGLQRELDGKDDENARLEALVKRLEVRLAKA